MKFLQMILSYTHIQFMKHMRKNYFIIIYTSFTRIYGICCKPFKINQEAHNTNRKKTSLALKTTRLDTRRRAQRVHISPLEVR